MAHSIRIAPATEDQVPLILEFIRGLAEYEKLAHEVVATEESLRRSLFGARPDAEVVIAYVDDEPAGFALFFHNYSTFLGRPRPVPRGPLREAGVPRPRRRAPAARSISPGWPWSAGCGRFEWWVLDWNEPAIRFYESLGARPMSDWTVYRLTGDALAKLAGEAPAHEPSGDRS